MAPVNLNLSVIILCVIYMFIGPSLILLNKFILQNLNFPFPMFLSGLGVAVSALVAQVLVRSGYVVLQRKEQVEGFLWYKRVLPVGLAHASTLAFGNTVYLFLNVGIIQMLKSFTPVIIMITAYLARIETPNRPVILSILVISIGTAATCTYTPQLSFLGLFMMLMAEGTEAIRLVLTQFLLQNLKFGVVEGQYVLAPASAFWLFTASLFYESRDMYAKNALGIMLANPMTFLLASCMGLGVNFLSYLVIQATSSLTMKVLGTVRNIFTIFLGVLLYSESISFNEGLGYTVALAGFVGYNAAKSGYVDGHSLWGAPLIFGNKSGDEHENDDDLETGKLLPGGASSSSSTGTRERDRERGVGSPASHFRSSSPAIGMTSTAGAGAAAGSPGKLVLTSSSSSSSSSSRSLEPRSHSVTHSSSSSSSNITTAASDTQSQSVLSSSPLRKITSRDSNQHLNLLRI